MKADSEQFREFLLTLPKQLSLDRIRSHWPKYAFHFTDIRNAAKILVDGRVRCRADLNREGGFIDIASPGVIAQTDSQVKDHVRLYFRPRTPTQYRSEGIRPKAALWENAHCPVPVFLLFDLPQVLARDDCLFSDGNLAKLGFDSLCSTASELSTFDFRKIYHGSPVSDEEKQDIVSHRNADRYSARIGFVGIEANLLSLRRRKRNINSPVAPEYSGCVGSENSGRIYRNPFL